MKKYLLGLLVAVMAAGVGCKDATAPLTEGSPDDPEFVTMQEEFDVMDDTAGDMVQSTLAVMSGVNAGKTTGVTRLSSADYQMSLEWDAVNESWVGSFSGSDAEQGITITATNVVQFRDAAGPVQYPNEQDLVSISSDASFEASGNGNTISATQAVTLVSHDDWITLVVNGNGRIDASFTGDRTDEAGTSTCTVTRGFTSRVRDVMLNTASGTEGCPTQGNLEFIGSLSLSCTGSSEVDYNRSWSVVRTFHGDTMTTRAVSGDRVWNVEEPCL